MLISLSPNGSLECSKTWEKQKKTWGFPNIMCCAPLKKTRELRLFNIKNISSNNDVSFEMTSRFNEKNIISLLLFLQMRRLLDRRVLSTLVTVYGMHN